MKLLPTTLMPFFNIRSVVPTAAGVIDHAGATNGGTTPALGVLMGVEYSDSVQRNLSS